MFTQVNQTSLPCKWLSDLFFATTSPDKITKRKVLVFFINASFPIKLLPINFCYKVIFQPIICVFIKTVQTVFWLLIFFWFYVLLFLSYNMKTTLIVRRQKSLENHVKNPRFLVAGLENVCARATILA